MKKLVLLLLCAGSMVAQEKMLKSAEVHWTGYGAIGGYSLSGTLPIQEAKFQLVENKKIASGKVVFNMKGISHEDKRLVKHLKSEDFFYISEYPKAVFEIEKSRDTVLIGSLTMRGVTQKVEVPCKLVNTGDQTQLSGRVSIDRTKFGVNYNSGKFFQNLGSNAIKDEFLVEFSILLE